MINGNRRTVLMWVIAVIAIPLLAAIFVWMRGVSTTLTLHTSEIAHLQQARAEIEKMRHEIAELKANARK